VKTEDPMVDLATITCSCLLADGPLHSQLVAMQAPQ